MLHYSKSRCSETPLLCPEESVQAKNCKAIFYTVSASSLSPGLCLIFYSDLLNLWLPALGRKCRAWVKGHGEEDHKRLHIGLGLLKQGPEGCQDRRGKQLIMLLGNLQAPGTSHRNTAADVGTKQREQPGSLSDGHHPIWHQRLLSSNMTRSKGAQLSCFVLLRLLWQCYNTKKTLCYNPEVLGR